MKDILKGQKQFSSGDHAGKSNKSLYVFQWGWRLLLA